MKIFFALTMLASAFARPERVERDGDRKLDGCYCYTPYDEIINDGFSEDSGTPDPSVFLANDDGNQARRVSEGASAFGGSWFLRGRPQGSDPGTDALLPGILYSLPSSYGSYPENFSVDIKVAATNTWRNNNSRAQFQYRLLNCASSVCTFTDWGRVINFDGDNGTNKPVREGSNADNDPLDGFFFSDIIDITTYGCYNYDNEKIEFRIVNTNAATQGNQNNRNFYVRQFYLVMQNCKSGY